MGSINKESPNFRDGRIDEARFTADYLQFKVLCSKVERGYVTVEVSPNSGGSFHIHFSGLGDKVVDAVQSCANGIEIVIKD